MEDPYEILGVGKDVDEDGVKKAFRKKAQENHPDRGGDTKRFQLVVWAKSVLSDDKRRAHFDSTGQDSDPMVEEKELRKELAMLVINQIESSSTDNFAVLDIVREFVQTSKHGKLNELKILKLRREKLDRALRRIKVKRGENLIGSIVIATMEKHRRSIANLEHIISKHDKLLSMIDDYEYVVDQSAPTGYITINFVSSI